VNDPVPSESTSESERPAALDAVREPQREAPARSVRDTSGPAIAATAALVLFSVFIGVFGPRIGNRQQVPVGVTLVELAEAVVSRSQPHFDQLKEDGLSEQDFAARIDGMTGSGVALPSLGAYKLEAMLVQPVRLPGGHGGMAMLRSTNSRSSQLAAIAIIEDEDRLTVYDRYSRPIAMPKGEIFTVVDKASEIRGVIEIYREGEFVVAVRAMSPAFAREIISAMQVAAAEREARKGRTADPAAPKGDQGTDRGTPSVP
jgi:hypothetical protein